MDPESSLPASNDAAPVPPPEPPLPADHASWAGLLLNLLMIPVGLLLLVPLAILVALWFYFAVCKECVRLVLRALASRRANNSPKQLVRAPHFTETREGSAATDEAT
jgi:hypothetical protein